MNDTSRTFSLGVFTSACLACTLLFGCRQESEPAARRYFGNDMSRASSNTVLCLATTTSARDSGVLDVLLPVFEAQHACRVDVVAVGTGAALKLGRAGDADALIVHAPEAEDAFMAAGYGTRREEFMFNEFTILGPKHDPARIRAIDPSKALQNIADGEHPFVSRGDDSGTHKREQAIWSPSGGLPTWDKYLESGQGMGATLIIADEKQAYTIADKGTYLRFREKVELVPLVESFESLRNPYSVIVINQLRHFEINSQLANALADFLISSEARQLICGYNVAGERLFRPTRLNDPQPNGQSCN